MPHTYASVAAFKDYLLDTGSSHLGENNDALYLALLEAASRRVDEYCGRSQGDRTGFGPRTGTNTYDGNGGQCLRLKDDLVSATTVTLRASTASSSSQTPVASTDYFLRPDGGPYRELLLHGQGISAFGTGYNVTDILGTWSGPGYGTLLTLTTVASGLTSTTTQQTFITSGSPDFSPGHTLLIDTEQLYLRELNGTDAIVTRPANGTTAAVHADDSPISIYTYHSSVVNATLQIALRRMKQRDTGAAGAFGGGGIGETPNAPMSEMAILRSTVGHLRLPTVF